MMYEKTHSPFSIKCSRAFVLVICLCASSVLSAASVLFDVFACDSYSTSAGSGNHLTWYNDDVWCSLGFDATRKSSDTISLNASYSYPEFVGVWVQTEFGMLIDGQLFENLTDSFYDTRFNGATCTREITAADPSEVYLAVEFYKVFLDRSTYEYRMGDVYYGWVSLWVENGDVSVRHSAVSLDGSSLMAGVVYPDPIPEPSACLLMVMGIAALGLRRAQRKTGEE